MSTLVLVVLTLVYYLFAKLPNDSFGTSQIYVFTMYGYTCLFLICIHISLLLFISWFHHLDFLVCLLYDFIIAIIAIYQFVWHTSVFW